MLLCIVALSTSSTALELTWEQAWEIARSRSTAVLTTREEMTTAEAQVDEARSAAYPNVGLSGIYTRNIDSPVFFINGMPIRIGLENSYVGEAQLRQPIWIAGKVGTALRAARSYLAQTEATMDLTLQQVHVQLARAFYGTILARELAATAGAAHERALQHRDRARLMFEQGVVSEYDRIRADVQAANLEPPLLQAENQYVLAQDNLRRLLNLPVADSVHVAGSLELADTTLPAVNVEQAYQRRPELHSLQHARDIQRYLISLARKDLYLPQVFGILNWQTQTQSEDFEFDDYSWTKSSAAMVQVTVPLFDGLRTPARVRQYRSALRQIEYAEQDLKTAIRIEVESAQRELSRALRTVNVQQRNVEEAQRGYEIARVRYESGVGTQLELLDAEFQLDQARVGRLRALYDAKIARLELNRALGVAPAQD